MFSKYDVSKTDGTPTDPRACYFVLRLDTDKHALHAAWEYACSVQRDDSVLAFDLMDAITEIEPGYRPRRLWRRIVSHFIASV